MVQCPQQGGKLDNLLHLKKLMQCQSSITVGAAVFNLFQLLHYLAIAPLNTKRGRFLICYWSSISCLNYESGKHIVVLAFET